MPAGLLLTFPLLETQSRLIIDCAIFPINFTYFSLKAIREILDKSNVCIDDAVAFIMMTKKIDIGKEKL